MSNLTDFLQRSADVYPEKNALVFGDQQISYQALQQSVLKTAQGLIEHGVKPGDKVALSCPNIPQFAIAYYAILATGAAVVPLNILLRANEIEYHLQDSQASIYLCFEGTADHPMGTPGLEAFREVDTCEHFFAITQDNKSTEWQGQKTLAKLLRSSPVQEPYLSSAEDTAVVLYTSGTTGKPKGAELTHANLALNIMTTQSFMQASSNDTTLLVLPLFHCFALVVQLQVMIASGGTTVMMPRFEPKAALQLMIEQKVTLFGGVPTIYIALTQAAKSDDTELVSQISQNLRLCISGGAALPIEALYDFEECFNTSILEGYGLSETSPAAAFNSLEHERIPGSVGRPISGVRIQVVDDNNKPRHPGQIGEVVIKGHNVMKGYLGRPEQTSQALRNGWFHTGDIGRFDEHGNLYIVDRLKDMIIRGGYNVYPRELEEILLAHPEVVLASVIGVPDEHYGEEVMACLVLTPGATSSADDVQEWAKTMLGAHKYPRQVEIFEQLPMTATGKILKRELRQQVLSKMEVSA